jgi:putative redox protein
MYRVHLATAESSEQTGARPDQRQQHLGERCVGHGGGAPQQEDEHDEARALPYTWPSQLHVQRDVGGKTDQHPDHVQGDVQHQHSSEWIVAVAQVTVRSRQGLTHEILVGAHELVADEPPPEGADQGANPYELLLGALGACTAMTLRMYADRKQWPLSGVEVVLSHERMHARDCEDCENRDVFMDRISKRLTLRGDLSDEQRVRLAEIAERCPVQRTLQRQIVIEQTLT